MFKSLRHILSLLAENKQYYMWYMLYWTYQQMENLSMSAFYLHCMFSHYDNGTINTLSNDQDELVAVKKAFTHAIGTELSDNNYEKAHNKIYDTQNIDELKTLEINYNARFYRRVIKLKSIKHVTKQEYDSLMNVTEGLEEWTY